VHVCGTDRNGSRQRYRWKWRSLSTATWLVRRAPDSRKFWRRREFPWKSRRRTTSRKRSRCVETQTSWDQRSLWSMPRCVCVRACVCVRVLYDYFQNLIVNSGFDFLGRLLAKLSQNRCEKNCNNFTSCCQNRISILRFQPEMTFVVPSHYLYRNVWLGLAGVFSSL